MHRARTVKGVFEPSWRGNNTEKETKAAVDASRHEPASVKKNRGINRNRRRQWKSSKKEKMDRERLKKRQERESPVWRVLKMSWQQLFSFVQFFFSAFTSAVHGFCLLPLLCLPAHTATIQRCLDFSISLSWRSLTFCSSPSLPDLFNGNALSVVFFQSQAPQLLLLVSEKAMLC